MRWERVFAELGEQTHDALADERDALADDLVAESWRSSSWMDFLAGRVQIEVQGAGVIRGSVEAVAEMIEIHTQDRQMWVEPGAVSSTFIKDHRRSTVTATPWRVQVGVAISSRVRALTRTGSVHEGILVNLGGDYLELSVGPSRQSVLVTRSALALISMPLPLR